MQRSLWWAVSLFVVIVGALPHAATATPVTDGLVLWLDADDASTITQTDGYVSQWNDKSPLGANFAVAFGEEQPALIDNQWDLGKPIIRFDGNDRINCGPDASLEITGEMTFMLVWKVDVEVDHGDYYFLDKHTGGADGYYARVESSNRIYYRFGSNAITTGYNSVTGSPQVVTMTASPGQQSAYINGLLAGSATGTADWNATTDEFYFGDTSAGQGGLVGDVAEMLIFNRALSTQERTQVEAYLQNKWVAPSVTPNTPVIADVAAAKVAVSLDPLTVEVVQANPDPGILIGDVNGGDHDLAENGDLNDAAFQAEGVTLATIREIGPATPFGVRYGIVEVAGELTHQAQGCNTNGGSWLAIGCCGDYAAVGDTTSEHDMATSVARFSFEDGWIGAHIAGDAAIRGCGNFPQGTVIEQTGTGRYLIDIAGVDSTSDGVLLAVGASNQAYPDVVAAAAVQSGDNTGAWQLAVRGSNQASVADGDNDNFSFVYVPYDTEGLIAAATVAGDGSLVSSTGDFTVTKAGTGEYSLSIGGGFSPESGILVLTASDFDGAGGDLLNNFLTYDDAGDGTFLIQSRTLGTIEAPLMDGGFSFLFLQTGEPGSGPALDGDLNGDGSVNSADLDLVRANWGTAVEPNTAGDATGDGFVNSSDLDVVRGNWGQSIGAVPEPGTALLLICGLFAFVLRTRR